MTSVYGKFGKHFLNRPGQHSDASVCWDITVTRAFDDSSVWQDGSFRLRDCDRAITIDIGLCNEKEYENSLRKLGIIEREAHRAQEALRTAWTKLCATRKRQDKAKEVE